jgi:phosphoglycerate dehydrogenase-like enzyme
MDNAEAAIRVVKEQHADLTIHPCTKHGELSGLIAETGAEVVYTLRFNAEAVYPRKALIESDSVKWVSVAGSGTDHLQPWNPTKVRVTNSAGVAADMMAEYAMAGMLHFSLNLDRFKQEQQRRKWISGKVAPVHGKTILIIGLGPTGQAVAKKCKLFNLETEPLPQDNPLWRYENVILTPHCSSVYDGWLEKSAMMFSENLSRYRGGEPLMNEVDPGRGY